MTALYWTITTMLGRACRPRSLSPARCWYKNTRWSVYSCMRCHLSSTLLQPRINAICPKCLFAIFRREQLSANPRAVIKTWD